jgi:hypothetical protein
MYRTLLPSSSFEVQDGMACTAGSTTQLPVSQTRLALPRVLPAPVLPYPWHAITSDESFPRIAEGELSMRSASCNSKGVASSSPCPRTMYTIPLIFLEVSHTLLDNLTADSGEVEISIRVNDNGNELLCASVQASGLEP